MTMIDYSKWDAIECSSSSDDDDDYDDFKRENEEEEEEEEEVFFSKNASNPLPLKQQSALGKESKDAREQRGHRNDDALYSAMLSNYDVVPGQKLFKDDDTLNKMKEMFYDYTIERDVKRMEKEYFEKRKRNPNDFSMSYTPSDDKAWRAVDADIFSVALCEFPERLRTFLRRVGEDWVRAFSRDDDELKNEVYLPKENSYHVSVCCVQDVKAKENEHVGGVLGNPDDALDDAQLIAIARKLVAITKETNECIELKPVGVRLGTDGGVVAAFEIDETLQKIREKTIAATMEATNGLFTGRAKPMVLITVARTLENPIVTPLQSKSIQLFKEKYERVRFLEKENEAPIRIESIFFSHETRWMYEKIKYRCELMLGKDNGDKTEDFEAYLKQRRRRKSRNDDDDSDDDTSDDDTSSSGSWDSDKHERACEKDKIGQGGALMQMLNNYIDIRAAER
jgi:DNA-binding MarR family transcriptional regulator